MLDPDIATSVELNQHCGEIATLSKATLVYVELDDRHRRYPLAPGRIAGGIFL